MAYAYTPRRVRWEHRPIMVRSMASIAMLSLALPAGSAFAYADDDPTNASETTVEEKPQMASAQSFEASFASVEAPVPVTSVAPEAVDLGTITPAREVEEPDGKVARTLGTRTASYYGRKFHGRRTANGEQFNMNAMTAAHKTLPFGTRVRVTNTGNGRSVVVRINDRGPFIRGRAIDLSRAAAQKIGMIARGHARVKLDVLAR